MSDILELKARLVLGGDVSIPVGFSHPNMEVRGGEPHSAVLDLGGIRVRKRVSDGGQFRLSDDGGSLALLEGDEVLAGDVSIVRMFGHSPETVTVSITRDGRDLTVDEALAVMGSYDGMGTIRGVTIHGERTDPHHYAAVVAAYRSAHPYPIGVGSSDLDQGTIRMLRGAGAVNLKTTVRDIGDIDEPFWSRLSDAVEVFGRGMVVCTLYITEDVSDDVFMRVVDRMCSIGAMPDAKVRRSETGGREATPERYCALLRAMANSMSENGLDGSGFDTMCYGCRLCMIVPFKDF